jgi:hypothetical protein
MLRSILPGIQDSNFLGLLKGGEVLRYAFHVARIGRVNAG